MGQPLRAGGRSRRVGGAGDLALAARGRRRAAVDERGARGDRGAVDVHGTADHRLVAASGADDELLGALEPVGHDGAVVGDARDAALHLGEAAVDRRVARRRVESALPPDRVVGPVLVAPRLDRRARRADVGEERERPGPLHPATADHRLLVRAGVLIGVQRVAAHTEALLDQPAHLRLGLHEAQHLHRVAEVRIVPEVRRVRHPQERRLRVAPEAGRVLGRLAAGVRPGRCDRFEVREGHRFTTVSGRRQGFRTWGSYLIGRRLYTNTYSYRAPPCERWLRPRLAAARSWSRWGRECPCSRPVRSGARDDVPR